MISSKTSEAILVVAGEASADAHGAKVVQRLLERAPGVECFGVGGTRLQSAGLEPVADSGALAIVGISEALRGLRRARKVFVRLLQETRLRRPGAALLLDLPDFNLPLARRLRRLEVPVVYYIAPQAWAWRKGRVRQLRRRVSRLCVVFPFEQRFFADCRVPVTYVGHPLTEEIPGPAEPCPNRVAIVPGSRTSEIERLLPALAGAGRILEREAGDLQFILPLAPGIDRARVRALLASSGIRAQLTEGGAGAALSGARLALVASGTATLEAALAGVPMVVVYRVSRFSYALVRPVYRLSFICIVNILAGGGLVPELLMGRVRPETIAQYALPLLRDGPEREQMIAGLRSVTATLGTARPSERVAEILTGLLGAQPQP